MPILLLVPLPPLQQQRIRLLPHRQYVLSHYVLDLKADEVAGAVRLAFWWRVLVWPIVHIRFDRIDRLLVRFFVRSYSRSRSRSSGEPIWRVLIW